VTSHPASGNDRHMIPVVYDWLEEIL
jgi:hypothetical protein